jgi:hypothetical protein
MERALAAYLAEAGGTRDDTTAVELPSFGRGGVRSGVDLDDTSALLDVIDGIE